MLFLVQFYSFVSVRTQGFLLSGLHSITVTVYSDAQFVPYLASPSWLLCPVLSTLFWTISLLCLGHSRMLQTHLVLSPTPALESATSPWSLVLTRGEWRLEVEVGY